MSERAPRDESGKTSTAVVVGVLAVSAAFFGGRLIAEHQSTDSLTATSSTASPQVHRHLKPRKPIRAASVAPTPSETPSPSTLPTPTLSVIPTPTETATPSATPTAKPSTPKASKQPLIMLDPGHSGSATKSSGYDSITRLHMVDYPNQPEMTEVFHVSELVRDALLKDGYRVMMTKNSVNDSPNFRQRADMASKNHAALEVSIHDDHGQTPQGFEAVYAQFMGGFRQHVRKNGTLGTPVRCENQAAVNASLHAAKAVAQARTAATGFKTSLSRLDFNMTGKNRPGLERGNLLMIDLFACQAGTPAITSEMGAETNGNLTTPLPEKLQIKYADGLIKGIEAAVPIG